MEKDGEKIKSKLKGRKKNNEDKIAWNIGVFFEFLKFWNEKFWRKSEKFHCLQFLKKKDIPSILWNSKKSLEIIQLSQSKIYL